MIAASGILVVIAFVTLIAGVFRTGLELIWVSIAASVLAAIFLALGVVQGNKRRVATAVGPGATTVPPWSDQPAAPAPAAYQAEAEEETAVMERPSLAAVPEAEEEEDLSAFVPEAEPAPAPAKASTRAAAPKRTAAGASASEVVVIPDRDKYHKATCRYAKNPSAMTMAKAAARRQGYKACGVCKP